MDKLICDKYAAALFGLAKEENKCQRLEEEAGVVIKELNDNPDFKKLMGHPGVDPSDKADFVKTAFEGMDEELFGFLSLIFMRDRGDMLGDILTCYIEMSRLDRNLVRAEIVSAVPLSGEKLERLVSVLENKLGKRVEPVVSVDAALIGGLKITVCGHMINSTISNSLDELKKLLKGDSAERRDNL